MSSNEHAPIGDDRATFNVYDQADRHIVAPLKEERQKWHSYPTSSASDEDHADARPSGLAKIRRASHKVRSKAKAKTNKILHPSNAQHSSHGPPTAPALAPAPSDAADEDRLFHNPPEHKGIQAKDLLHNPVNTVQSALHGASGAKMAGVLDNQVIAHGANVNLVRAHDKVASAEEEEKESALRDVEGLKKARQDTYVRWTMDRHVLKVRRIPPHDMPRPRKRDYISEDEDGKGQLQWAKYGQDLARFYARQYGDQYIDESPELPPATEEAINTSLERLLMTSIPYQVFLMNARRIYRWDDPWETGMWLGGYIFFWIFGQLAAAAILIAIFFVLRRRFYPPTVGDLRESIKQSEDIEQTATNLTQLIEQNGSRGWMDAMIKEMGPRMLLQLEDMADTLEIVRNFYEWRSPQKTMISLSLLFIYWLYISMTPLWLFIKSSQFSAGVMFFGLFPIASRFPHYRIIVSPWTWLFWKVPTDAEWAVARLQTEAHHSKKALSSHPYKETTTKEESQHEPSESQEKDSETTIDIGKYHCTIQNHHGDLHVDSEGVRYVTAVRSNEIWKIRYDNMKTIQKARFGDQLTFTLMDDSQFKVMGLKQANEVFTQMIGYSGLVWQVTS